MKSHALAEPDEVETMGLPDSIKSPISRGFQEIVDMFPRTNGLEIPYKEFAGLNIKAVGEKLISEEKYRENALKTGKVLLSLGGTENIINLIEK